MAQLQYLVAQAKSLPPSVLLALLCVLLICYPAILFLRDPLRSLPGPFWARFTRVWYLNEVSKGNFEKTNIQLHKKYGLEERDNQKLGQCE